MPPALMVFARVDSFTPTRPMMARDFRRSVDVGPTDSPSFVVFAIKGRPRLFLGARASGYPVSCARIAQACRAFLCANATAAMLMPRRFTSSRNQTLCGSVFSPR